MLSGPRRVAVAVVVSLAAGLFVGAPPARGEDAVAGAALPRTFDDDPWLSVVNAYRSMSGLGPVTEEAAWSSGALNHSCYMLLNGVSHDEVPGLPGYTPEGDLAGNNGNVAATSLIDASDRSLIELWMTGPFHAVGVLRPNLTRVGYGRCNNESTKPFHAAATLDVLRGLVAAPTHPAPITFPGSGATIAMDRFIAETPNPLTLCGWTGSAGVPAFVMMPEPVSEASTSMVGPGGPVETCTLTQHNTDGVAKAVLASNNVVVALPRTVLRSGTHTVTVTTAARVVSWSFDVDPTAADRPITASTPVPVQTDPGALAGDVSAPTKFEPMSPLRVVDTREGFGAGRLHANGTTRVQIAGAHGVPSTATAVSANLTVTGPAGDGFLTAWNCSPQRPVVATLNYRSGETLPNGAAVPLDESGAMCLSSLTDTDVVVDINGYYSRKAETLLSAITPVRLMDTRVAMGATGRLAAGQTVDLTVAGVGGIPKDVQAVVLNVASVDATRAGFVTVHACDRPRPLAASLNPTPGVVRPNLVVAPVGSDGRICFYTLHDVDLVVDATAYLRRGADLTFTSTTPFRLTDTREAVRPDVNAGTEGGPVPSGGTIVVPVAGQRGIPHDARVISVNLAVTGSQSPGFVTAYPCGDRPPTASVNYGAGVVASNGAQLPLSPSGALCLYVLSTTHVVIDVNGWWT